jgi:hypothetical protein
MLFSLWGQSPGNFFNPHSRLSSKNESDNKGAKNYDRYNVLNSLSAKPPNILEISRKLASKNESDAIFGSLVYSMGGSLDPKDSPWPRAWSLQLSGSFVVIARVWCELLIHRNSDSVQSRVFRVSSECHNLNSM